MANGVELKVDIKMKERVNRKEKWFSLRTRGIERDEYHD